LYELRAIAENIVRERCETSEVHPPAHSEHEADVHPCEVEATNATNIGNTCNLSGGVIGRANRGSTADMPGPDPEGLTHCHASISTQH